MAHHAYLLSVPAKIWPHVRATLAAGPAHKPRLDIGSLIISGQPSPLIAIEWLQR